MFVRSCCLLPPKTCFHEAVPRDDSERNDNGGKPNNPRVEDVDQEAAVFIALRGHRNQVGRLRRHNGMALPNDNSDDTKPNTRITPWKRGRLKKYDRETEHVGAMSSLALIKI